MMVALEADFLNMAEGTVTHNALSTTNLYGAPVYSTAESTFYAHVERGNRVITTAQGKEVIASGVVYVMSSSAAISEQDKLTLPNNTFPPLLRVDVMTDDEGQHHLEVYI